MIARRELSPIPGGNTTADILRQAYMRTCFPTPFHDGGDTQVAQLIYGKVAGIPFSPYWRNRFQEFQRYNGNPAGTFARDIFEAARTQEGKDFHITVADRLADQFADDILQARVDSPLLATPAPGDQLLIAQELSSLARLLINKRRAIEGPSRNPKLPRAISEPWIALAHILGTTDPLIHNVFLKEIGEEYNMAAFEARAIMESEAGWPYGYSSFDRIHDLERAIAKVLAAHYPDLIVSHLQNPPELSA